jgi:hypothetical protein
VFVDSQYLVCVCVCVCVRARARGQAGGQSRVWEGKEDGRVGESAF